MAENIHHYPPVVTVLGHVDHGKTSLLDAIRKTSIADREHGGITQKIGASSIETVHETEKRVITFIDTPGHEAFSQMRSRGATAADIGILVVSAVDGVMPQTRESIKLLQQAQIPIIVALTKVDLPTVTIEKVKGQIVREGLLLEGLGGDIPTIEVSAKTGKNVKELLDLILLVHDLKQENIALSPAHPLKAIIIESKLDPKSGAKATIVIKDGLLKVREIYHCEGLELKIRTIFNTIGASIPQASIGDAVEILGFTKVPAVGSLVTSEKAQVGPVEVRQPLIKELVYTQKVKEERLGLILCTDTEGSLEAILAALPKGAHVISTKTGEISEADVLMAKSTGAIVLSFNTKIRPDIQKLAQTEKVLVKNYTIIYEMLDEIDDVIEGKQLAAAEQVYGVAQIMGKFPFEKTFALGIKVMDGRVAKQDKVRIMRGETNVGESTIASLRTGKNVVSKVEKGHEAGIVLGSLLDFQIGDVLICHN